MVCGGVVDGAAGDDRDARRALDHLACVFARHLRVGRQAGALAGQPCRRRVGWHFRGSGMDGIRDSNPQTAVQPHRDRVDRRRVVERVALASQCLVNAGRIGRVGAVGLPCGHRMWRVRRISDSVQSFDGLGLRTHAKSVCGDIDACQYHHEPADAQPTRDHRGASGDLFLRAGSCLLDRRRNHSRCTRFGSLSSRNPTNFECRR